MPGLAAFWHTFKMRGWLWPNRWICSGFVSLRVFLFDDKCKGTLQTHVLLPLGINKLLRRPSGWRDYITAPSSLGKLRSEDWKWCWIICESRYSSFRFHRRSSAELFPCVWMVWLWISQRSDTHIPPLRRRGGPENSPDTPILARLSDTTFRADRR